MVSRLQWKLREMVNQFCKVEKVKDKDNNLVDKTLIHNTYLMAWFLYNNV